MDNRRAKYTEAVNDMFQRVYLPAFLGHLENKYGVKVANADDVQNLVKMASYMAMLEQQQLASGASNQVRQPASDIIKEATNSLAKDTVGYSEDEQTAAWTRAWQIAQAVRMDPSLRDNALLYAEAAIN